MRSPRVLSRSLLSFAIALAVLVGAGGPVAGQFGAPTGLQSSVNSSFVTLTWNAVAGAGSYLLEVGRSPLASDVFRGTIAGTTASGSAPTGTYYWRVRAVLGDTITSASQEAPFTVAGPVGAACVPPAVPQNLTHTVVGFNVTLNWSGSATNYVIEAGSATGLANLYNAATGSAATTLSVNAPAGTYFVRVRARNSCGTSAPSNERIVEVPNSAANRAPLITSPGCTFSVGPGGVLTCPGSAVDPDVGDVLTWRPTAAHTCTWYGVTAPAPANSISVSMQGTVPATFNGSCNIEFQICDQRGACVQWTGSYAWNQGPTVNRPPVVTSPSCTFTPGAGLAQQCTVTANDPDPGDVLTVRASLPNGHTCLWLGVTAHQPANPLSVLLQGTVPNPYTANCTAVYDVCDQRGACVAFKSTYTSPVIGNRVPVITSPGCTFSGGPGSLQSCVGSASDPDGDLMTWRASAAHTCSWFAVSAHASSNPISVVMQGVVPANFNGTCTIDFQICDTRGGCTPWGGSYTWNVNPSGLKPYSLVEQGLLVTELGASNFVLQASGFPTGHYGPAGDVFIHWLSTSGTGFGRVARVLVVPKNNTNCEMVFNGRFKDVNNPDAILKWLDFGSGWVIPPGGQTSLEDLVPVGTRTSMRFWESGHFRCP